MDKNTHTNHDKPSSKRKASLTILIDEIDQDEPVTVAKKELNTPKKIKTEACKVAVLRSPYKENGHKVVVSPKKELKRLYETSSSKISPKRVHAKSPTKNGQDLLHNKVDGEISRFPLTPVDNIQETQNNEDKESEDIEQKSCVKMLLFEGKLQKSPVKSSPNKNHVINELQNHDRKNQTPKKIPFKGNFSMKIN